MGVLMAQNLIGTPADANHVDASMHAGNREANYASSPPKLC